jgi:hypothetical protein
MLFICKKEEYFRSFRRNLILILKQKHLAFLEALFPLFASISLVEKTRQDFHYTRAKRTGESIGAHIFDTVKNRRIIFEITAINKQNELAKFYRGEIHHLMILYT